jgi:hypothetical protein
MTSFVNLHRLLRHYPFWLLANVIKPLLGSRQLWTPGVLHLITAYAWILAPVLIAPLIILEVPGFPGAGIEQSAPQALIYGWVLQFGYALIPYLFRRVLLGDPASRLGGNWFSLLTVHAGGILLWAGIFVPNQQGMLHGIAYGLWFASLLPITYEIWRIVQGGVRRTEDQRALADGLLESDK